MNSHRALPGADAARGPDGRASVSDRFTLGVLYYQEIDGHFARFQFQAELIHDSSNRSLTVAALLRLLRVCSHLQSRDRKGAIAGLPFPQIG